MGDISLSSIITSGYNNLMSNLATIIRERLKATHHTIGVL